MTFLVLILLKKRFKPKKGGTADQHRMIGSVWSIIFGVFLMGDLRPPGIMGRVMGQCLRLK